jgi:hypothetical protein
MRSTISARESSSVGNCHEDDHLACRKAPSASFSKGQSTTARPRRVVALLCLTGAAFYELNKSCPSRKPHLQPRNLPLRIRGAILQRMQIPRSDKPGKRRTDRQARAFVFVFVLDPLAQCLSLCNHEQFLELVPGESDEFDDAVRSCARVALAKVSRSIGIEFASRSRAFCRSKSMTADQCSRGTNDGKGSMSK